MFTILENQVILTGLYRSFVIQCGNIPVHLCRDGLAT